MSERANVKCTCGGEFQTTGATDLFKCGNCGKELNQIAGQHLNLLETLCDDDDPAISDMADSILSFKPGEKP